MGFGFRDGAFALRKFEITAGAGTLAGTQKHDGDLGQNPRPPSVVLHGVTAAKTEAQADGQPVELTGGDQTWSAAEVPAAFNELAVSWGK